MANNQRAASGETCPSHFYHQSAVVPCRVEDGLIEVLLITSVRKGKWVIPKGVIEPGLTPQASAAMEALEEAGIEGRVLPEKVGSYSYKKWGGVCDVSVYLMIVNTVHDAWSEADIRRRKWVSGARAHQEVGKKRLIPLVRAAVLTAERYFRESGLETID